jgi:hypothetical protein
VAIAAEVQAHPLRNGVTAGTFLGCPERDLDP